MVSMPVVVLLFDWTFLSSTSCASWRRSWPLYLGLASSWLVIAALQFGGPRSQSAGFGLGIRLADWWSTQTEFFVMYLKLAVWPAPLVIHYALPQLDTPKEAWPSVAAVVVLACATLVLLWRRRSAGWLLASVFAILSPTHLVPIATEIAAERRMYLPLAALVALAVVSGYWLIRRAAVHTSSRKLLVAEGTAFLSSSSPTQR